MVAPESGPDRAADLGFSHRLRKSGEVELWHHGRLVSTLRARAAADFRARATSLDAAALQQLMARLTGNYKRGNERAAAQHRRRG
jgi:hypothetical protein